MKPETSRQSPAKIEYLIKEVAFSTCDSRFFSELEDEMLIPNNVNIYGKLSNAETLKNHELRLEFPGETAIGYIKQPLSNNIENNQRILTYNLEELVNYDDYWWFSSKGETEFSLRLNLLPPFPDLKPVGLEMACRPDIAVGLDTDVETTIRIKAKEDIDQALLKLTAPLYSIPGIHVAITAFSDGDTITEARQTVTSPRREYPFPHLSAKKGESLEFKVTTHIKGDPRNMSFLKCEQDIIAAKLLTLSKSSPDDLPCGVTITDGEKRKLEIENTMKSTILQATAQVMYSPFSIRREPEKRREQVEVPAA